LLMEELKAIDKTKISPILESVAFLVNGN